MSESIISILESAEERLLGVSESPRLDAQLILCMLLGKDRSYLISHSEDKLDLEVAEEFRSLIAAREQGVPVAYIIGEAEFWSLKLKVNTNVLVPRADTEVLIEEAIERCKQMHVNRVLDLGTGSGAIAIALAKELPDAQVVAVDKSKGAIEVAKSNAQLNSISNIKFINSSWYEGIPSGWKFDIIVSNPPYIAADDPHVLSGGLKHEPYEALVAENNGLHCYEQIIPQATDYLSPNGLLMVEHGWQQRHAVESIFHVNNFNGVFSRKDLGGNWRVVGGYLRQ